VEGSVFGIVSLRILFVNEISLVKGQGHHGQKQHFFDPFSRLHAVYVW